MIVSGICTAIVLVLIFGLMARHALRMSNPQEQLKIMRIINLIPAYQILSYASICFPNAYVYLQGFTEVFQGIALYSFLMLMCDFMAPTDQGKVEFFSSLEIKEQWRPKRTRNGLKFLKRCCEEVTDWNQVVWWSVLQYTLIAWGASITQVATQAVHVYCLSSMAPHFSHIWARQISVATSLSTGVAVNAIVQFYVNMKGYMAEHRPLLKLLAFKLIVGVIFLEKIIFMILSGTGVLKRVKSLTYIDIAMGLPTMVICVQMVPLALFVCYTYRTQPYEISNNAPRTMRPREYQALGDDADEALMSGFTKRYQGGWLGLHAWAVYLSPLTLFIDVREAYVMIHKARAAQKAHFKEQVPVQMDTPMERYDSPEGA
ncbi:unnamed protein product [Penicillium manginii]